jgi:DNA-binding NtrC family response regulator
MTAAMNTMQLEERGGLEHVADAFHVVLCSEASKDLRELEAILQRLGIRSVTAIDLDQACAIVGAIEPGLTIFSFGFSGRCTADLISWHQEQYGDRPFAFWTPDPVADLENVVAAIRLGAVDVIHGVLSESKMASLIEQSRLPARAHGNGVASNGHESAAASGQNTNGARLLPVGQNGCGETKGAKDAPATFNGQVPEATVQISVRDVSRPVPRQNGASHVQSEDANLTQIIRGRSSAIEAIRNVIRHVAPTQATVMIHGESGTGKELVARAIHNLSKRSEQPFVPVNMAAIPNGLAESFLFGHEKGSFTSAVQKQKGWCRVAHRGTLFLDEIGEMELEIQPKLLRFLQEGSIQTVGAQTVEKVDVRLVTATNQDPRDIVREGRLREDLFFRLNVIPIYIPPLRDRCDDIEELAMLFLQRAAERHERPVRGYSDEAMEVLVRHDWPGNVRQLENMVERLVIFAEGDLVEAMEIPAEIHAPARRRFPLAVDSQNGNGHATVADSELAENIIDRLSPFQINERTVIIDALQRADGHVIEAAGLLGLGQATMYRKIKQYVIPHQRKRRRAAPK